MDVIEMYSVAAREDSEVPLSEPEIIPTLLIDGITVEIGDGIARLCGWVKLAGEGRDSVERRIVMRVAMANGLARKLNASLQKGLRTGIN